MEEECGPSAFAACARPELVEGLKGGYADLGGWPDLAGGKKPVLYHPAYNISFFGLERLHPFDSKKYQQVLAQLEREGVLRRSEVVAAAPAPREALLSVHAAAYLDLLETSSRKVAQVRAGRRAGGLEGGGSQAEGSRGGGRASPLRLPPRR